MVVNVFKLHMSVYGFCLVQSAVKNEIILFIFIFLSMTSPARNARVMFFKARNFLMRFFKNRRHLLFVFLAYYEGFKAVGEMEGAVGLDPHCLGIFEGVYELHSLLKGEVEAGGGEGVSHTGVGTEY